MVTATRRVGAFIVTKEHRRFVEFANAVRQHRYIGLCFGAAGVGKTLSAQHYANWPLVETLLYRSGPGAKRSDTKVHAALTRTRTLFYTPEVGVSVRVLNRDLEEMLTWATGCIRRHTKGRKDDCWFNHMELVIVDETERLSTPALEYLRALFDRSSIGLMLIGMPGMEKRLARYPQLYSRIGFAHHYRQLHGDELSFVLTRHWRKLGLSLDDADFTDAQAIAAIARITGGNFRLLHRLFAQIDRILQLNELTVITDDVVQAASSTLVIGAT